VLLANSFYEAASPGFAMGNIVPSIEHYEHLAEETGGRVFDRIESDMTLPVILKTLAKQVLAYTHVAGYYTDTSDKPRLHEAQVVLRNPNMGKLTGGSRIVVH